MNRVDQLTRVLSDNASGAQRSPALELLRERGFTGPRNNSLTQSMFGPVSRDTSLCKSMFGVHKRAVCDLRRCLLCFRSPYLEMLIPASPTYEVEEGLPVRAVHSLRSRRISGNRKRTSHAPNRVWSCTDVLFLPCSLFEGNISCWVTCKSRLHATVKCAVRLHGLACMPAGQNRAKSEVGLNNLVTGAEVRDFPRW
jgi:hypothetical protein